MHFRDSDLDISYVPAHESTHYSITVLLADVLVDLYPIRWSALERMANFDDISCTVLLDNEIVYQRSEDAAARFRALLGERQAKDTAKTQQERAEANLRKALEAVDQMLTQVADKDLENIPQMESVRRELFDRALVRKQTFFQTAEKHLLELQPLG